jgi:hypothetical protein
MLVLVDRFEASTALPYEHLERATAGLRAQLRAQLLEQGATPDWSTFEVTGPTTSPDGLDRPWFKYRASVTRPASTSANSDR